MTFPQGIVGGKEGEKGNIRGKEIEEKWDGAEEGRDVEEEEMGQM